MKTKFSKKALSFILAVMMVVTSVPMAAFSAFAAEEAATDPAVLEVQSAMDAFEAKLSSAGAFTNVKEAYAAYVNCQKAIDAYVYGGETNALTGVKDALTTATANIGTFTPVSAGKNVVPTFSASTVSDMQGMPEGYNNILFASQAESIGSAYSGWQAGMQIFMAKDLTVLYDGTNDVLIPVMLDTYKSNGATPDVNSGTSTAYDNRVRTYSAYPSTQANGTVDDPNFQLTDYWMSGAGNNANWNWNFWSGKYNNAGAYYDPSYNASTGNATNGTVQMDKRTGGPNDEGMVVNRSGTIFSRKYTSVEYYHSNILKYVGGDFVGGGKSYTIPFWYGASARADDVPSSSNDMSLAGTTINVVNYKYLTDALAANGNKMKAVDLGEFSEGGLTDYINAMEAAVDFDPTTYFTSSNNYASCAADLDTIVNNMNNASTDTTNSVEYDALRSAMSEGIRNTFKAGNTGYTVESWDAFSAAYAAAQAIMASANDSGYASPTEAGNAATALAEKYAALQTKVTKVDTAALEAAIDTFEAYEPSYFTSETYTAVQAVVVAAKTAVWGAEDQYKVKTSALEDSAEAQAAVAAQLANVNAAVLALAISPDAVVAISNGERYSINSALALAATVTNKTDYSNYVNLETAVNAATIYKNDTLPKTDFTDLNAQLQAYAAVVEPIITAYNNLQYSFTRLPDGTVTGTQNSAIATISDTRNDNYHYNADFNYPSSATVFRTKHEALTVDYGNANFSWRINIDHNINKTRNAVDSITIAAPSASAEVTSTGTGSNEAPALSDAQRTTYAGCLAKNGFSLTGFHVTDTTNDRKTMFALDKAGNEITDRNSNQFDAIIGTTEGIEGTHEIWGALQLQPSSKGDATISLAADMNVDIEKNGSTPATFTENMAPAVKSYTYTGEFGYLYAWNVQPVTAWAGYRFASTYDGDATTNAINSTVSVVDMSYLVDLVDMCNGLSANSAQYTDASWSNLLTNLTAAQADLNYTTMTADKIAANLKTRYINLLNAYKALELKKCTVTFSYTDNLAVPKTQTFTVTYGDTLVTCSSANTIKGIFNTFGNTSASNDGRTSGYTTDTATVTFREWSPSIEYTISDAGVVTVTDATPIYEDVTYEALYDTVVNKADWTAFNTAKEALNVKLQPGSDAASFVAADLDAINTTLSALEPAYITYTTEQQSAVTVVDQAKIDEQTAKITELTTNLTAVDKTTYDPDAALAASADKDRFDIPEIYRDVTIIGFDGAVKGYVYATQAELDAAINAAVRKEYTITIDGSPAVGTDGQTLTVPYGTTVTVDSNGVVTENSSDTTRDDTYKALAWFYEYSAPSTDGQVTITKKYICTASAVSFVVKGDTALSTVNAASADGEEKVVKFQANLGNNSFKNYYVAYADASGNVTFPEAPTYPYYTFANEYTCNGEVIDIATFKATSDCTIVAKYNVITTPTFNITYYSGYSDWSSATVASEGTYSYNQLVELTGKADETLWFTGIFTVDTDGNVSAEQLYLLHYGVNYSFYACEAFDGNMWDQGVYAGIVSMTQAELEEQLKVSADSVFDGSTPFTTFFDGAGNEIKAEGNTILGYTLPANLPSVRALDAPVNIYDSTGTTIDKVSLVGSYAAPEGYTVVESGYLVTKDVSITDLTIAKASLANSGISRMKSTLHTVGDQFVINLKTSTGVVPDFNYVAYTIFADAEGNCSTYYSEMYTTAK